MPILSQGVGDSAQGFANCILFVFLVPSVRDRYRRAICSCSVRYLLRSRSTTENNDTERGQRDARGDCKGPNSEATFYEIPLLEGTPGVAVSEL